MTIKQIVDTYEYQCPYHTSLPSSNSHPRPMQMTQRIFIHIIPYSNFK